MKWMKRTAALLASLLLLSLAVQAQGPAKAKTRTDASSALIRIESSWEFPEAKKIPILPVLPPVSEGASLLPETEEEQVPASNAPVLPVLPAETPASSTTSPALSETPKASGSPVFPEAEDWQLLLVNPWNEMPEDYEVDLVSLSNGLKIDQKVYDALSNMLGDCKAAGLNPLVISAYRTQAKQTSLYNNRIARFQAQGYSKAEATKLAGRWVARPGTSEHQLGLAVDIVSASNQSLTKAQEKTKVQKWLMEHCWEYGFILRYPNDKSEITGIGYEPWHYRYVGVDVAQDVRASGLCFEEYLLLREETLGTREGTRSRERTETRNENQYAEINWEEIV